MKPAKLKRRTDQGNTDRQLQSNQKSNFVKARATWTYGADGKANVIKGNPNTALVKLV